MNVWFSLIIIANIANIKRKVVIRCNLDSSLACLADEMKFIITISFEILVFLIYIILPYHSHL